MERPLNTLATPRAVIISCAAANADFTLRKFERLTLFPKLLHEIRGSEILIYFKFIAFFCRFAVVKFWKNTHSL
jgi:hypothetical protein